ncbi:hypothetical protein C882_0774 [Caenispirillum salinarum AK4]|uniref:Uncharacterized protein n=1 Tax=Caenispirillum salinarum AK4 TaxID=1238182 RepID=K9HDJ2_9PROT|nr:hypothetical protein C882_0774 [Caenispirillum salinarum AK4]
MPRRIPVGGAEHAVEQHVPPHGQPAAGGAQGIIDVLDGRQGDGGDAGAQQQRRHADLQPVQHAGRQESGNQPAAAFDEHPRQPAFPQGRHHRRRPGVPLLVRRHRHRVDPGGRGRAFGRAHQKRRRGMVGEDAEALVQRSAAGDDDTGRRGACDPPRRQPGIVRTRCAGAHHHSIGQCPQAVHVVDVRRIVDGVRMPA